MENPAPDRRQDRATSASMVEALRMETAFGDFAARHLRKRQGVPTTIAERALAGRHDPRQVPRCS